MRRLTVALLMLLVALLGKAALAASSFDALAGQWRVAATQGDQGAGSAAKVAIEILPKGDKVQLKWTVPGSAAATATFAPAGPPGVYGAVEGGMFGLFDQRTNRDPLASGELLWLRVPGSGFILYNLIIADNGGYRLDRIEFVPVGDRLQVVLSQREDGKAEARLSVTLTRVGR
jgi:hypothetical protein